MLARGGVSLRVTDRVGAVLKHPSGKPRFGGLERGVINLVLADRVPLDWDNGRSAAGAATIYEGYCVCVISMVEAHGNQAPFFGVNTVAHELRHVLMGDVFEGGGGVVRAEPGGSGGLACDEDVVVWGWGRGSGVGGWGFEAVGYG